MPKKRDLTEGQLVVLRGMLAGANNAYIAGQLNIAEKTVMLKYNDIKRGLQKNAYNLPPDIAQRMQGDLLDGLLSDTDVSPT